MSRFKASPPPPAASAAQIVTLLGEAAAGGAGARETLAARHYQRRRAPRPGAKLTLQESGHDTAAGGAGPAGGAGKEAPQRAYIHEGPTGSIVFNAFLHELSGPGAAEAARTDVSRVDDARLAMRLLDLARQYLPRVLQSLGDVAGALELLPWIEPNPKAREPLLYLRAAVKAGGELGVIARDFEAERQLLADGQGDRQIARCMIAAFAGQLVAHAARIVGYHIYEDFASNVRNNLSGKVRRSPVRVTNVSSTDARRKFGSGSG